MAGLAASIDERGSGFVPRCRTRGLQPDSQYRTEAWENCLMTCHRDPSYHFPTRFYLERTNICVFCDFRLRPHLAKFQQVSQLRKTCPLGSSPAAPATVFRP
jgi:hypothetical protein